MMCELTDIVKLLMFKIMYKLFHRLLRSFRDKLGKHLIFFFFRFPYFQKKRVNFRNSLNHTDLTHSFPMNPFSTP